MTIMCERSFEEYPKGEITLSYYFKKILCTPCEKEYERRLEEFRIRFINKNREKENAR